MSPLFTQPHGEVAPPWDCLAVKLAALTLVGTRQPQAHGSTAPFYAHSEDDSEAMNTAASSGVGIVRVNTSPVFPRLQYKDKHARYGRPSISKARGTRSMVIHMKGLSSTSQSLPDEMASSMCQRSHARPRSKGGLSVEKYREAFSITVNDLHPTKLMQISKTYSSYSQLPSAGSSRYKGGAVGAGLFGPSAYPTDGRSKGCSHQNSHQSIKLSEGGTDEETLRNSVYVHPRLPRPGSMTHLQSMSGLLVTKSESKAILVTSNRRIPSNDDLRLISHRMGERVPHPGLAK
ncbi:hypothetical protein CYMTET_30653 [Cymbomonas tetramitiformis]|uniref:Uncharacterized protein n=1 Tax=Cymbomonas tetramitiformis TaxID=36881 RepID=A0AAE0KTP9_9CHLO|nr:hypothetical protein CYMTET_30653 [Cymbomonas tetramitiformis]